MQSAFESWVGQEVVVQLAVGQIKMSLHGVLLRDQTETLLMRPEAGSDIEIAKTMVLAIEEVASCLSPLIPHPVISLSNDASITWFSPHQEQENKEDA